MTKQRILVVEDEAPIRQMVVFNLSRAGFEVDVVDSIFANPGHRLTEDYVTGRFGWI